MGTMRGGCCTLWLVLLHVIYLLSSATAADEETVFSEVTFSNSSSSVTSTKTTTTYYSFTEDDPNTRVVINKQTKVHYKKINTRVEPDGTKITIYLKKTRVGPDGSDVEVDWDDLTPTNVIRAVKEKVTPSGQQTFLEFEGTNTKEKVVTTRPGKDGIDITIIRKKFRIGPDGKEYEVDWDEEGSDIIVKNMERTNKPDGTISITEVFESGKPKRPPPLKVVNTSRPPPPPPQNVQIQYIQSQPDGSSVNLGVASQAPPNPSFLVQQPVVDPRFKVLNTKQMPKNGGHVIVYEVKVLVMPDGSEIITHLNDNSPNVRTRLFRKLLRSDGKILVTEVSMEVPSEITLFRIYKIIKKKPDGTLVELDADVDTEPNAELVTRLVRTRKKTVTGEIIEVEDDLVQLTRKVYQHTSKGIFVTEYRGGLVVKQYESKVGLALGASNPKSSNARPKDISSFGGGLRDGFKGVLGFSTVAGDLMGGMLGVGAISNRKNIADDALDFFTEGVGSIADIPGSLLDNLADSVGLGFIVRPAAYTGGFALGAVGGQETLKVKWGFDAFKLANVALGIDGILHRQVAPPEKMAPNPLGGPPPPAKSPPPFGFPGIPKIPGMGSVPVPGIPFKGMFGFKK